MSCMSKTKPSHWLRDRRTATEAIRQEADRVGSITQLERDLSLSKNHLHVVLGKDSRGFNLFNCEKIRSTLGIPVAATMFRHERICDVMKEELRGAPRGRR